MAASSVEISSSSSPLSDDDKGGLSNDVTVPISKKSGDVIVLREGMQFASLQEFESFYYNFALSEGFTVRIKRTNKFPRSDKIRYRQYVCSCAGFCEEKKSNDETDLGQEKSGGRITCRTGCRVTISVSNKKSIWKVGRINKEHNHPLASPSNPCRKDLRRKNLDIGGASAVLQYCVKKKAQDPNFFYAIQTDEEDRLANFFWIDSIARQYYERFGDVLIFDTTYRTNKNGLSLGNFVGVNNNIQSIMFGFALL
ncbi:protein FAR1-RELATED SEQUENCE 5-like [Carex rostrata]